MSCNIAESFGTNMAVTLGKALLWACFDDNEAKGTVEDRLCQRIRRAYEEAVRNNPLVMADREGCLPNPICKQKLILFERDGIAVIEEVRVANGEANAPVPAASIGARIVDNIRPTQQHESAVMNELSVLRDEIKSVKQDQRDMFRKLSARNRANDRLLQRLAHFALKRRGHDNNNNTPDSDEPEQADNTMMLDGSINIAPNATLSKCPRDLHILWEEFEHGLEGRKPAKDFNDAERGQVASTYSKRNHVWRLIRQLVNRRGIHYSVAIDLIYSVYGNVSVTKIIKAIQKDGMTGRHNNLT